MSDQTVVQWQTMPAWVVTDAPREEKSTVRRVARNERHFQWPPAGITMPKSPRDLDADRLAASAGALPDGLRMEFAVRMPARSPAFYITKRKGGVVSHWATFALHIDPIYGENTTRQMPRQARKWLGRAPWATLLMVAHQVQAWCAATYPDPRQLPVATFVSDVSNLRAASIDPILYGVMVAGTRWGFVPLAEWRL